MKLHYKDILKHLIILFVLFLIIGCGRKESNLSIIPEPLEVEVKGDQFIFTENTKVLIDSDNPRVNDVVNYFVNQFNSVSGHSIKIINSSEKKNNLIIFTDKNLETSLGSEGYILESDKDKIVVSGTPHGLFYGVQTLFQLLPKEIYGNKKVENISWSIPSVEIKDKPRFKWRGMHLDVCRHMFPLTFIKKYIDYIAMHKLNTFHWHLTEDQGWRIEIKKYPRLTEIGAWRKGTQIEKTDQIDDQRYGGYYTQEEIKEIVKYAE
ncbi:MAG: family 20 glycosylhydrolase, partial [Bacteroidota bacterium]